MCIRCNPTRSLTLAALYGRPGAFRGLIQCPVANELISQYEIIETLRSANSEFVILVLLAPADCRQEQQATSWRVGRDTATKTGTPRFDNNR